MSVRQIQIAPWTRHAYLRSALTLALPQVVGRMPNVGQTFTEQSAPANRDCKGIHMLLAYLSAAGVIPTVEIMRAVIGESSHANPCVPTILVSRRRNVRPEITRRCALASHPTREMDMFTAKNVSDNKREAISSLLA